LNSEVRLSAAIVVETPSNQSSAACVLGRKNVMLGVDVAKLAKAIIPVVSTERYYLELVPRFLINVKVVRRIKLPL
jgi:hypothetical protein